ncbi:MAG: hypothetical protein SFU27_13160 [Thermonemataceae bacterium]|nr:hypothetical protein [Thermonemataceae bacterium]
MKSFAIFDFSLQILILVGCFAPLLIHPYFIIFWMFLLPLLGVWQMASVGIYAYRKELHKWHKLYLKVLPLALLALLVTALLYTENEQFLFHWILIGLSSAAIYLLISFLVMRSYIKKVE